MNSFSTPKKVPDYLIDSDNVIRLIAFTTVFSLVFINIYRPFNSTEWLPEINSWKYFIYSSLLVIIGMAAISLSRVVMMFHVRKRGYISIPRYAAWIFIEVAILSVFYVLIGLWLLPADKLSWSDMDTVFIAFKKSVANTTLMLIIPYAISILYLKVRDLEMLLYIKTRSDENENEVVELKDEKDRTCLTVKVSSLYYIESADNYVIVKYMNNDKLTDFILRNTMKNMADALKHTPIQRCSRSALVNFCHINSLTQRSGELWLQFDTTELKEIPVAKMLSESASKWFRMYSNNA